MNVPLLDLKAQYAAIKTEVDAAIAEVLESQHFILGPKVEQCEKAIAAYSQCSHAIGVSSGSDALLACLMAENIGPGDEVITTPYTFFATVGAIARLGATPVFVDIDPATYNLDVSQIASKVTPRHARHHSGASVRADGGHGRRHARGRTSIGLVVIEDAAQAIGAEYKGRRAGSIGHYGCFLVLPLEESRRRRATAAWSSPTTRSARRSCGACGPRRPSRSIITRWSEATSAWTRSRRPWFPPNCRTWTTGRRLANAMRSDMISSLRAAGLPVDLPAVTTDRHIFNQYVIRVSRRDELQAHFKKKGSAPKCITRFPCTCRSASPILGYEAGAFPESERAAKETLALPIHPELTEAQARVRGRQHPRVFRQGSPGAGRRRLQLDAELSGLDRSYRQTRAGGSGRRVL